MEKFQRKMSKKIGWFRKQIKADLTVTKYTNTWYVEGTRNHRIIFYKKE